MQPITLNECSKITLFHQFLRIIWGSEDEKCERFPKNFDGFAQN